MTPTFTELPAELILAIMKKLVSFNDLESFMDTNPGYQKFYEDNKHGICGAIARTEFGHLWVYAYQLLSQQGMLYYEATNEVDPGISRLFHPDGDEQDYVDQPGHSVLERGTEIGEAEVVQLLAYKNSIEEFRPKFIRGVAAIQDHFLGRTGSFPIELTSLILTPDQQMRVDRAIYQYWTLYLACVLETMKRPGCEEARCPKAVRGHRPDCWRGQFEALDDEAKKAVQVTRFSTVDEKLPFKNSVLAIREIEQARLALYATHDLSLLPVILGPPEEQNSPFQNLYSDNQELELTVKEYLEYRAGVLGIEL